MEKYGLSYYENEENILNTEIMKNDKITFNVLISKVNNKCSKVFTDHSNIVICHTCDPWPIWIWTSHDVNESELKQINECLENEFPLNKGYVYNLSYELANRIIGTSTETNNIVIKTNLISYKCSKLTCIPRECQGHSRLSDKNDIEEISKIIHDFTLEAQNKEFSEKICRGAAEEKINNQLIFVWENSNNEIIATTSYGLYDDIGKIALVYTLPQFRGGGYAENLVYTVTKNIMSTNHLPVLYADGDYVPSNKCYQKLGYERVGSLCTIGLEIQR